jgi:murein DD-endopeptidase MepM/ murein hydrolase activator NlpD
MFTVIINVPVVIEPSPTLTPIPSTPEPTVAPTPTVTPTPTVEPAPEATPTPVALGLPWPPPPPANPIYGSGPIEGLAVIWGGLSFPISQEYGHTLFSLSQPTLYAYGTDLGLDGRAHPGLDIGMGRGTYLYSPINGTVVAAGGTGGFSFYGNALPGVGELRIQSADGHQVVLGHMAAIAVSVGDEVTIGQFVGLSGGDNGDHLHLEVRHASGDGYVAVDPRLSFLIPTLASYNTAEVEASPEAAVVEDNATTDEQPPVTVDPGMHGAGISDGNGGLVQDPAPDGQVTAQAEAGISDGNDAMIALSGLEAARREDEAEQGSTPDGATFLQALVTPPEAPVNDSKQSAIEAIIGRESA